MSEKETASEASLDTGHDYDGIRELDNRLPNWWLLTLFGAIVFSFGYWMYYHSFEWQRGLWADLQQEEAAAAEAAAKSGPVTDEMIAGLAGSDDVRGKGEAIFKQQCAVCHGDKGEGKIGPNLTDKFWLHGSKPSELYKTISTGVTAKGMPAWEPQLGSERTRWLAAYVSTLRDKNIPGKAPEGTPQE